MTRGYYDRRLPTLIGQVLEETYTRLWILRQGRGPGFAGGEGQGEGKRLEFGEGGRVH